MVRMFLRKPESGESKVKYKFERCPPDDPNRCQAVHANMQCPYKSLEGATYCGRHQGGSQLLSQERQSTRLYKLAQWSEQLNRQADHPNIKSLREEIGILRITLQERLASCEDGQKLLMFSGSITEMVREIAKTIKTCHALEMSLGTVLDKSQAQAWVSEVGEILSRYIDDADVLQFIAEDMISALERRTADAQTEIRIG